MWGQETGTVTRSGPPFICTLSLAAFALEAGGAWCITDISAFEDQNIHYMPFAAVA